MKRRKITYHDLQEFLNKLYPADLAEEWDKVGSHFGQASSQVHRIMTALDVRPEVVEEAISRDVDTLVVHHPPIFHDIRRLDESFPDVAMYNQLIKADMNVFAMHTNLDRAENGMNDWLAQSLDLEEVYTIQDDDGKIDFPRIGRLKTPLSQVALLKYLKDSLKVENLTYIEKAEKAEYQTVAVVGGAGISCLDQVKAAGADVFITGDISYHQGHQALDSDMLVIDASHYIESVYNQAMAQVLNQAKVKKQWDVEILSSEVSTNPFQYYK